MTSLSCKNQAVDCGLKGVFFVLSFRLIYLLSIQFVVFNALLNVLNCWHVTCLNKFDTFPEDSERYRKHFPESPRFNLLYSTDRCF